MSEEIIFGIFVFIVSICIGSFMNVVIYRVPKNENVAMGRSYCPKCNNQLKWYHNFPVFSWLFLRGKCGFCNDKISIQYPVVELFVGLLGISSYYLYGLTYNSIFLFLALTTLFSVAAIDYKYKLVPNGLSFLALIFAIISSFNYLDSIQFSILAIGSFTLLRIFGELVFGKEIMGEGDLLIAGIIGAIIPTIGQSLTSLFITAILALIPSLYSKYKGNKEEPILDDRFKDLELISKNMKNKDLNDLDYQYKMEILSDGVENMKWKSNGDSGIPFIPYLFMGLLITLFFNINFYV